RGIQRTHELLQRRRTPRGGSDGDDARRGGTTEDGRRSRAARRGVVRVTTRGQRQRTLPQPHRLQATHEFDLLAELALDALEVCPVIARGLGEEVEGTEFER